MQVCPADSLPTKLLVHYEAVQPDLVAVLPSQQDGRTYYDVEVIHENQQGSAQYKTAQGLPIESLCAELFLKLEDRI